MSKRGIGAGMVLLGILLVLTPWYIFPVCGHGRYAPKQGAVAAHHGCANTLKAETALGILTAGLGLLALLRPTRKTIFAASCSLLALAGLAVLFPLSITGLCRMATMLCRMGTLPGLVTLAILMAIVSILGLFQTRSLK